MNNVEMKNIVLSGFQEIDAGRFHNLYPRLSDDVVYQFPSQPAIVGIDSVKKYYNERRIIKEGRHEVLDIIMEGNVVAVRGRFKGVLKDGKEVSAGFADFYFFDDGKISKFYAYSDAPAGVHDLK